MRLKRIEQRCSFCGKQQHQVDRLVAGPGVFICDQCVALAYQVVNEEPPRPGPATARGEVRQGARPRGRWLSRWFNIEGLQPHSN